MNVKWQRLMIAHKQAVYEIWSVVSVFLVVVAIMLGFSLGALWVLSSFGKIGLALYILSGFILTAYFVTLKIKLDDLEEYFD